MIISHKHKFVFISTPKAGTNTMYKVLKEEYEGIYQRGEKTPKNSGYHCNVVPDEYKNYFIFGVCRHPYTRTQSQYRSASEPIRNKCNKDVNKFVSWITAKDRVVPQYQSQQIWMRPVKYDKVLHLEHIDDEIKLLKFWKGPDKLPVLNSTRPDRSRLNNESKQKITIWEAEIFKKFGYEIYIDW